MEKKTSFLGLLISASIITGCATAAPYSYQEHCALQGMKFVGTTENDTRSVAWIGGKPVFMGGRANAISCVVPETPKEKCEINRWQQVASPKVEYNEHIDAKRNINGLADLLIVPGVVAKILYDGQRSDAIDKSVEINKTLPSCQDDDRSTASAKNPN